MPSARIDRMRAGLERFELTGETPSGFLAPDFELHQAPSIVDTAGVFRGPSAFRDSLQELTESFDELTFSAEGLLEAPGGEVVVLIHTRGRGRGSGVEIDNHIAWVWSFRGDRAVRMVVYEEPDDALEAVGLATGDSVAMDRSTSTDKGSR
jgi:ketosteroid isomerase-like protein